MMHEWVDHAWGIPYVWDLVERLAIKKEIAGPPVIAAVAALSVRGIVAIICGFYCWGAARRLNHWSGWKILAVMFWLIGIRYPLLIAGRAILGQTGFEEGVLEWLDAVVIPTAIMATMILMTHAMRKSVISEQTRTSVHLETLRRMIMRDRVKEEPDKEQDLPGLAPLPAGGHEPWDGKERRRKGRRLSDRGGT